MQIQRLSGICLVVLGLAVGLVNPSWAQTAGAITGRVTDATGAVLPGVTVEAASPALIEKVRSVVTDGDGLYRIIDLRPGTYRVTFTLAGFNSLTREGLELSAGFTATVNASLPIGDLSETVTVTGQSPLVDVASAGQATVLAASVTEALPTGRSPQNIAVLVPGVVQSGGNTNQDVGGSQSERISRTVSVHGSRPQDMPIIFDGMRMYNVFGRTGGANSSFIFNPGIVAETSLEISGQGAEAIASGVQVNIIPREGGNRFSGTVFGSWANGALQANNIDAELQAQGLPPGNTLDKQYDINPSIGGPIRQDRVWFYASARKNYVNNFVPGAYYSKDPRAIFYEPDLTRPAFSDLWSRNYSARVTWQASPRNKLAFYYDNADRCNCHLNVSPLVSPETSFRYTVLSPTNYVANVMWTAPVTNRLLLQGGWLYHAENHGIVPTGERGFEYSTVPLPESNNPDFIGIIDQSTGRQNRSTAGVIYQSLDRSFNLRFAVNYVTGRHSFKVGMTHFQGTNRPFYNTPGDIKYFVLNGVPTQVQLFATPFLQKNNLKWDSGIFIQDQWRMGRLTFTPGLRFDFLNAWVDAQEAPAARFVGPRSFPAVHNLPNWKDISPRLAAAYDVFGDGRTAVKASLGRYVIGITTAIAREANPLSSTGTVNQTTRAWTDSNGDFIPQENELGPSSNPNFGTTNVADRFDPAILEGWGKRPSDWELSLGVQRQLTDSVSASVTYVRHWYEGKFVRDNLAVAPADHDPYCITAPTDARLPSSGQQLCGLYDVSPAKFGLVDNLITLAKPYGDQQEVFDGVDVALNLRFPGGTIVQAGTSTGRTRYDDCFVVDNPGVFNPEPGFFSGTGNRLRTCALNLPFQTQLKLLAAFALPWDVSASVTYQDLPGTEILANFQVTSAQAAASLGRPLAGGVRTTTVPLIDSGTLYGPRLHQVDMRFSKTIRIGGLSVEPQVDLYNALNTNTVTGFNNTYGAAWQRPLAVLPGRLLKLGAQITF